MVIKRLSNTPYALAILTLLLLAVTAHAQDKVVEQASQQTPQTTADDTTQTAISLSLPELIYRSSEHFSELESADLDGLLQRIGDARLVLLGEASHGTAEFYDMRARITRELIANKGFDIVAIEADWPDATAIDYFVRGALDKHISKPAFSIKPFSGYPSWMWANHSVMAFTRWLRDYNRQSDDRSGRVAFYGLDIYNLYGSIEAVLDYLWRIDPPAAQAASRAYACLKPWSNDPSIYSKVMKSGRHRGCAEQVSAVLNELRSKQASYQQPGNHYPQQRYFNALQSARMAKNAERYYRTMYDDATDSWNQRDENMFATLLAILQHHGRSSKAVIWAHNSHLGDSRATDRSERGEINLGQRARESFADSAYLIGFGTDHGTVAAASAWGGPMRVLQVPPSHKDSYGYLFHQVTADNFLLPLRRSAMRTPLQQLTREKLQQVRLQRAIGTTYDPDDELNKHYSSVSLSRQFDEFIWFDETRAVKPLDIDSK